MEFEYILNMGVCCILTHFNFHMNVLHLRNVVKIFPEPKLEPFSSIFGNIGPRQVLMRSSSACDLLHGPCL